jgi:hypothetical protein
MKIFGLISRLAVFGTALALTSNLVSAAPQPGKAELTLARGVVTINDKEAKVGDIAGPGSTIATGAGSAADLFLGVNGPTVQIQSNAKLTFEELSFDDAGPAVVVTTKVKLEKGKIAGYVKKSSSQSTYTVSTPTTTAAIRGTTYLVDADGNVWVWDGCVDVVFHDPSTGSDTRFNVCAGQAFMPKGPNGPTVVVNELPNPVPPTVRPPVSSINPVINISPSKPTTTPPPPPPPSNLAM